MLEQIQEVKKPAESNLEGGDGKYIFLVGSLQQYKRGKKRGKKNNC